LTLAEELLLVLVEPQLSTTKTGHKYTVIRDDQEKANFWDFVPSQFCAGTISQRLPTGDYTLRGYENLLTIERKASTGEVYKNIFEARFDRELVRLDEFKYPFMVFEFTLEDLYLFPWNSGIPKYLWPKLKAKNHFMVKTITEYQIQYKVKVIFAGKRGKDIASSIFKRVIEYEPKC
jgi:hypothetical protein